MSSSRTDVRTQTGFVVSSRAMFRIVDGEAVILDLDAGEYYGLNQVGTRVWQLVAEHASFDEVCELLLQEFDIDRETLQSDMVDLLTDLLTHGLLLRDQE